MSGAVADSRSAAGADGAPPVDLKELVRRAYDSASHAYRGDTFDLARTGYAHWLARLESRLAPGSRVLDLGCGNGVPVAAELARRHDVTGVDLSPVMIERARALVPRASFKCADMAAVAYADGAFDAVTAFFSVFNLPLDEQPELFQRIGRWLVPGGTLLAIVGHDPASWIEHDWCGVPGATVAWHCASVTQYRAWCEAAGLEVLEQGREPRDGDPGFAVLLARRQD